MQTQVKNSSQLKVGARMKELCHFKIGDKVVLKKSTLPYYFIKSIKGNKASLDYWQNPVDLEDLSPYTPLEPQTPHNPLGLTVGDRVASSDPNSLAYCWKGTIVAMHSDCPDACWVEYLERRSELKLKETRITVRFLQLRRISQDEPGNEQMT